MIRGIVTAVPSGISQSTDPMFVRGTGVRERRIAATAQSTFTLGGAASSRLLEAMKWESQTIQNIICVTQTPPVRMPATACKIAGLIGASCAAFDVNLACSGYVYGLYLASRLPGRTLLVAGDTVSRMVEPTDHATAELFGDAVSATAWEWTPGCDANFVMGTDGRGFEKLIADPTIRMDGAEVFGFALETVPKLIEETTMNAHLDWLFLHQANAMLLKHILRKTSYDSLRTPSNIERYGNTSSASIPLLMCDSTATPWLKEKRNRVALFGFGAGWSIGGVMMELNKLQVCEVIEQ